jgi:signal transduction histidine kinase
MNAFRMEHMEATLSDRQRIVDAAIAATAAVGAVVGVFFEVRESAQPVPPPAGGYALAILAGGALYWRRRAPWAVCLVIIALCLLYHELSYPGNACALAMFVAVHAVTAEGTGVRSLVFAMVAIVVVNLVPMLPPLPASFSWAIVGPAIGMVAAAALGEAARARGMAEQERLQAVWRTAEEEARRRHVEERLGIARDVHDVLAHTLAVISVQAAAAAEALDEHPAEAGVALAAVRGAAKQALTELQSTLVVLRGSGPEPVTPQPRLDQLPQLVEQAGAAGLQATLTVNGDPAVLAASQQLAIYRIIQEGITNTIRHSGASRVAITVAVGTDSVEVDVIDNGSTSAPVPTDGTGPAAVAGTAASDPRTAGHGLIGMRERLVALGGTLEAGPVPGTGFRVSAHLPVPVTR